MNLPVLKYFIVISECKNFTKASERLFITQPTLSRQIQDLEEEMGVQLLQRGRRILTLTDAGKRFLKEAKEIVRRCDNLPEVVKQEEGQQLSGTLRIGFLEYFNTDSFSPALQAFAAKNPSVDFALMRNSYQKLQQHLQNGKCDLAFTMKIYLQDFPEFRYVPIETNKLQVAVPKSHPLAYRDTVDIDELKDEKFILMERKMALLTVDYVIGLCTKCGFSPKSSQYVSDVEAALLLVGAGKGITFLFSTMHVNRDEVAILDVNGDHDALEYVAAYRKEPDNPVVDLFLQELREQSSGRENAAK